MFATPAHALDSDWRSYCSPAIGNNCVSAHKFARNEVTFTEASTHSTSPSFLLHRMRKKVGNSLPHRRPPAESLVQEWRMMMWKGELTLFPFRFSHYVTDDIRPTLHLNWKYLQLRKNGNYKKFSVFLSSHAYNSGSNTLFVLSFSTLTGFHSMECHGSTASRAFHVEIELTWAIAIDFVGCKFPLWRRFCAKTAAVASFNSKNIPKFV